MNLLAFELATEACSVALWLDGDVHERFEIAPRRHAELALPWAGQLLAEAGIAKSQLDAIAVGRGPGAFTGVRLSIAIGQGIALALDRPMLPVSTLAALAAGVFAPLLLHPEAGEKDRLQAVGLRSEECAQAPEGRTGWGEGARVLAAIDARMGEVYSGAFECCDDQLVAIAEETVGAPDQARLPGSGSVWHGVGTGFSAADGFLQQHWGDRFRTIDATALPRAADVARLAALAFARGEAIAAECIEPAYLRNNVALTLEQQRARRPR
ncbi:MAG: tRNA (adenosine(37)-N6)-threonylcarbamoyltransferase complex dimerization subunit type 1 TsaB [Pseudomonadota bacterium]|nr:tRNA (adenosine(37)-N6)-threonylcarbamoyltransferase complex dimerization subunit type 1 TsaB [Pseudomonadota bacterium]